MEYLKPSFTIHDNIINISASIGIATFPTAGTDINTLVKCADIAIYCAKKEGRNKFQYFSTKLNIKHLKRLTLESALKGALKKNEFYLEYQSKYDKMNYNLSYSAGK